MSTHIHSTIPAKLFAFYVCMVEEEASGRDQTELGHEGEGVRGEEKRGTLDLEAESGGLEAKMADYIGKGSRASPPTPTPGGTGLG